MRKLMFVSLLMLSALITFAQSSRVRGKVTGKSDGLSLPGVNVVVKGTTTGTITDLDGNYEIEVQKIKAWYFLFWVIRLKRF